MALASLKDLYFDELGDLYDAEMQMIRTLPRLVEAARAPELRETLRKHCDESRLHLERLELIFTHWGERRSSKPCAGLAGIVQEADERLTQTTCGLWARAPLLVLDTAPQAHSRRCDGSNVKSDSDPASSQGIRLRVLIVAGTVESGLRIGSGAKTWGQARVRHLGSSRADLSRSGRRVTDL